MYIHLVMVAERLTCQTPYHEIVGLSPTQANWWIKAIPTYV